MYGYGFDNVEKVDDNILCVCFYDLSIPFNAEYG